MPTKNLWSRQEDEVVLSRPPADAAAALGRSLRAVMNRRQSLRSPRPTKNPGLTLEEAKQRIVVPRYDSKEHEEKVRFVAGPYAPPLVEPGGWLKCELRGDLEVDGYSLGLIPWPMAKGKRKQYIVCGDLVRALNTESVLAVAFHFGLSHATVCEYRRLLGVERFNPGSVRLFWRSVNLARTPEARAKISKSHEGRTDTMTPEERQALREIQRRPKSEAWKQKMSAYWKRRTALIGQAPEWTEEEIALLGTRPDREVAKLLNRSIGSVKAKRFGLRKNASD